MRSAKVAAGRSSWKLQIISGKFQNSGKYQNNTINDVKEISNNGVIIYEHSFQKF